MPGIAKGFGQGNGLGVVFVQGGLNRCALAAGEDQAQRLNAILFLGLGRRDLQKAVKDEQYEEAARIRDEIKTTEEALKSAS